MKVELDVFSGRPNPIWHLSSGLASEIASEIQKAPEPASKGTVEIPGLGYRGFILWGARPLRVFRGQVLDEGSFSPHAQVGPALERRLLDSGRDMIEPTVSTAVLKAIEGS